MSGIFKTVSVFLRNEVVYKPMAKNAGRALFKMLQERGWGVRSVKSVLGLGAPAQLACMIIFESDQELKRFEASNQKVYSVKFFREELIENNYPTEAVENIDVAFYSYETIQNAGGLYSYLK